MPQILKNKDQKLNFFHYLLNKIESTCTTLLQVPASGTNSWGETKERIERGSLLSIDTLLLKFGIYVSALWN